MMSACTSWKLRILNSHHFRLWELWVYSNPPSWSPWKHLAFCPSCQSGYTAHWQTPLALTRSIPPILSSPSGISRYGSSTLSLEVRIRFYTPIFSAHSHSARPINTRERRGSLRFIQKWSCCQYGEKPRACHWLNCCQTTLTVLFSCTAKKWIECPIRSHASTQTTAHPLPSRPRQIPCRQHHCRVAAWARLESAHPPTIQPRLCGLPLSPAPGPEQHPATQDLLDRKWLGSVPAGGLWFLAQNLLIVMAFKMHLKNSIKWLVVPVITLIENCTE